MQRGKFELNCLAATASVLSNEMIESEIVNPRSRRIAARERNQLESEEDEPNCSGSGGQLRKSFACSYKSGFG